MEKSEKLVFLKVSKGKEQYRGHRPDQNFVNKIHHIFLHAFEYRRYTFSKRKEVTQKVTQSLKQKK